MPILAGNKFAYLAIPKSGSSWVVKALEAAGLNPVIPALPNGQSSRHAGLHESRYLIGNRFVFCTVRHPIRWLRSWYLWQASHQWGGFQGPTNVLMACRSRSFQGFLENYAQKMPGEVSNIFSAYMDEPLGGIDRVGRTEDLPGCLGEALVEAGVSGDLNRITEIPPVNVTADTMLVGTQVDLELALKVFMADEELFRRFDYQVSDVEINRA